MTDKELSKLKRTELLEILVELRKRLDESEDENRRLREELSNAVASTEKMVKRLYEDRFGPFEEAPAAEEKTDE